MKQDKPTLSAVIVAGKQRERAGRALQSILSQDGFDQAEVVLVDSQRLPLSEEPRVACRKIESPQLPYKLRQSRK